MILKKLNLNSLLIFRSVYESASMTLTAKALGLTQSGVSQHISALERDLETKLFIRGHKEILPTKEAEILYKNVRENFNSLEKTIIGLTENTKYFKGNVNIGVPIEFGNNIVLPLLAEVHTKMPNIKFKIVYGLASEMNGLLLKGELDFAFIDQLTVDKKLHIEDVYEENLFLCSSEKYVSQFGTEKLARNYFEKMHYIAYMENAPIVRNFFQRALNLKKMNLDIVAQALDVQGVATLITNSMGVAVLPEHVINKLKSQKLHIFSTRKEVKNKISLVYHPIRLKTPLIEFVCTYLKGAIKELR